MKKTILLLVCAGLAGCFFLFQKYSGNAKPNRIYGGPTGENKVQREAWERKRYADPTTGKIPEGIALLERQFVAGLPKATQNRSGALWTARGPWNIGGRTRALAVDITNENRLLAGGVTGGLWLSEDGGQSWERRTPPDAHPGCVSIAQDTRPGKTNTWYYLGGEISGASAFAPGAFYFGDGLFKSSDGGMTWDSIPSTAIGNPQAFTTAFQTGWRILASPVDSADVLYMACYGAIYKSVNGGGSWTVARGTSNLSAGSYYTDVAMTSTGVLYATLSSEGTQKGIWRSPDGVTWTSILPPNFPATYNRVVIGINPDNENEVYFLGATPGSGHSNFYFGSTDWSSLWKYTYLGGTGAGADGLWENRSANLPNTGNEFDRFTIQGGYDLVVKVQPGTGNVFIGGTSVYRSTDGFATPNNTLHIGGWKTGTTSPFFESYENHHPDQHEFLFLASNPNVMLTAGDGGVQRTENCNATPVAWTSLNNGYQTTQAYTAIIDRNAPGDNTIIGCFQDNANYFVNSADTKAPWKITINGDGTFGGVARDKAYYVLSINGGQVAKCQLDDQGNVLALRRIDPIGPNREDYLFVTVLALDPADDNVLYLPAANRLYRQNDLANIALTGAWDTIAQGWTLLPDTTVGIISAVGVSRANPAHRVYVGTDSRRIYRIDNAHTGTPSMVQTSLPNVANNANVSCIAVDPDNADRIIVAYSNYSVYSLWLSENAGQTWQRVGGNLEANFSGSGNGPSIRWVSILRFPDGSRKYFAATSAGLFSADTLLQHTTTLPGTQWTFESPDLIGNVVVDYVDTRDGDGLVLAATHGIGIYTANYLPVSGSNEPGRPQQARVFPNPATDMVQFDLPGTPAGRAVLHLFDQKGRLVRQANWSGAVGKVDLSGLAKGVYFYRISGSNGPASGKIVKVD